MTGLQQILAVEGAVFAVYIGGLVVRDRLHARRCRRQFDAFVSTLEQGDGS